MRLQIKNGEDRWLYIDEFYSRNKGPLRQFCESKKYDTAQIKKK